MTYALIVSGAILWAMAAVWGAIRVGAACDGRKW